VVTTGKPHTGVLHYTAPPVIGGVEAVIQAHARVFVEAGYPVTVVAGWSEETALPPGVGFVRIPEMDSRYQAIVETNRVLERGEVPDGFDSLVDRLVESLAETLECFDSLTTPQA
jgi:hypothetical protein